MDNADWARVEKDLSGIFGRAVLQVDGRRVTFMRRQINENTLGIVVYVDGKAKGEWLGKQNECSEQRYFCPKKLYLHPATTRAKMREISKPILKKMGWDPDQKMIIYHLYFNSFAALRRHYQKTFKSLERVEED